MTCPASTCRFAEPDQFQAAVRGGGSSYSILGRGVFGADLTTTEVGGVKLQYAHETLPRLAVSGVLANQVAILLWPHHGRLPVVRGVQVEKGELLCIGANVESHHRTTGPNAFAILTLARLIHEHGRDSLADVV
jgi:hypothetical protein